MNLFLRAIFTAAVFATLAASTFAKPWHGIVPLRSTKADVEKAMGTPASVDNDGLHYELTNEQVVFALAGNNSQEDCAQKLPADTVIRIAVTPRQPLTIKAVGLPEDSFSRSETFEPQEKGSVFINEQAGVLIRILKEGIDRFVYFAEKKDQYLCLDYYMDHVLLASRIICRLCPTVAVTCPDETEIRSPMVFTANMAVGDPAPEITYQWTASAGTIIEGQGTSSIKVYTKNLAGKSVTATVKVGGIDSACNSTASCTTPITARKN